MVEKSFSAEGQEAVKSSLYQANQGLSKKHATGSGFAGFDMARHGASHTLCKDERLSRELLLDKLFKEGKAVSQNGFTLIYLESELPVFYPAQAAFSVPKRIFKKATDRNTIKRHLRESYRLNKLPLYQKLVDAKYQLIMMFVFKGKEVPKHSHVEKNVIELLQKLIDRLKWTDTLKKLNKLPLFTNYITFVADHEQKSSFRGYLLLLCYISAAEGICYVSIYNT